MPDNSRIEDLRKRYHENPRRFFAPLANEYRKAGLLDRALLLCQKHVAEQPENMNGLVVYGQTLFELQQPEAARAPFEQALQLDPENLIALRHLGDIARHLGDTDAAKGWYERVLELDRRNDEVIELLAQLGGGDSATDAAAPAPRPSVTAGGLVSVAPTVSVSGGGDFGFVELDGPPKPPAGKGGTAVIDAQSLANRDRADASAPAAPSAATPAAPPAADPSSVPTVEIPQVRPSKRASLLDISFDFGEPAEPAVTPVVPEAPVLGAEAAEYGFAADGVVDPSAAETLLMQPAVPDTSRSQSGAGDTLIVETTGDVAPLGLEPTIAESAPLPAAAAPGEDLELADFSAEVSPLAGLEATEFTSEQVAPMAEFEPDSVSVSLPSIHPLADLDRPNVTLDDVAPLDGLDAAMAVPAAEEPSGFNGLADLPLLDDTTAEPSADEPLEELPSARPRPRMTKADLASLPLLADFGLEDDSITGASASATVPAPEATTVPTPEPAAAPPMPAQPEPAARASKATPTFVTETMAALYVKQGLFDNAIDVYRQLVAASPDDAGLRAKLSELERMQGQGTAAANAAADEMPDFDTPLDAGEPLPAPANAAMDGVSFGDIGLRGQGAATPIVTPAVPAGPTAREFFGGFARRAAVVTAATASPVAEVVAAAAARASAEWVAETAVAAVADEAPAVASGWPLDAIFGAANDVRDLHAAETLAGVGTFTGPDGGTGIGELFASESAPPRRAVPRASETLKFDQFFQKPGTASSEPVQAEAAPGDDDLDQFQDWLKGLKQ